MTDRKKAERIRQLYAENKYSIDTITEIVDTTKQEVERVVSNRIAVEERAEERTAAKEVKIINMYENGRSIKEICKETITQPTYVKALLRACGYDVKRYNYLDARNAEICQDAETMTVAELAEKYKVCQSNIRYVLGKNRVKAIHKKQKDRMLGENLTISDKVRQEVIDIIKSNAKERGWQKRLAEKYSVSRQLVSNIYQEVRDELEIQEANED